MFVLFIQNRFTFINVCPLKRSEYVLVHRRSGFQPRVRLIYARVNSCLSHGDGSNGFYVLSTQTWIV